MNQLRFGTRYHFGSILFWRNTGNKLAHKAVSVPYAGVFTPVRGAAFADAPAGQGHCLIPDNDPAVTTYRLKRSKKVVLEVEP